VLAVFCLWVYKIETFCGAFIHLGSYGPKDITKFNKKVFLGHPTEQRPIFLEYQIYSSAIDTLVRVTGI